MHPIAHQTRSLAIQSTTSLPKDVADIISACAAPDFLLALED